MCASNHVDDPVEFVEKWMTFSIAKFNGSEPTFEYLEVFERNELKNQQKPVRSKHQARNDDYEGKRLKLQQQQDSDEEENDLLGAYITVTPKVINEILFFVMAQTIKTPSNF